MTCRYYRAIQILLLKLNYSYVKCLKHAKDWCHRNRPHWVVFFKISVLLCILHCYCVLCYYNPKLEQWYVVFQCLERVKATFRASSTLQTVGYTEGNDVTQQSGSAGEEIVYFSIRIWSASSINAGCYSSLSTVHPIVVKCRRKLSGN